MMADWASLDTRRDGLVPRVRRLGQLGLAVSGRKSLFRIRGNTGRLSNKSSLRNIGA